MQPGEATANKFPTFNPRQWSKANKVRLAGRRNAAKKVAKQHIFIRFRCCSVWLWLIMRTPLGCMGCIWVGLHLLCLSAAIGWRPDRSAHRSEENCGTELPGRKWCKANYRLSLIHPHQYSAGFTLAPHTEYTPLLGVWRRDIIKTNTTGVIKTTLQTFCFRSTLSCWWVFTAENYGHVLSACQAARVESKADNDLFCVSERVRKLGKDLPD